MTDTSPFLARPLRSEGQAVADRICRRLTDHIEAMTKAGALDRELASEIQAKIDAVCMSARPALRVAS